MNPTLRISLVALGAALLATAAALAYLLLTGQFGREQKTPARPAAVLVAARTVEAGSALSPADITWRDLHGAQPPPNGLTDGATAELTVIGSTARRQIRAGELLSGDLVSRPDPGAALATTLNPGWRAVTVKAEATDTAAGLLRPNDRVDVVFLQAEGGATPAIRLPFLSAGGDGGDWRSHVLLQDARVLAVNGHLDPRGGAKDPLLTGGSVTLEVRPADAALLLTSASAGRLGFMVRRSGDPAALAPAPAGAPPKTDPGPRPTPKASRPAPSRPAPQAQPTPAPAEQAPAAIIIRATPANAA